MEIARFVIIIRDTFPWKQSSFHFKIESFEQIVCNIQAFSTEIYKYTFSSCTQFSLELSFMIKSWLKFIEYAILFLLNITFIQFLFWHIYIYRSGIPKNLFKLEKHYLLRANFWTCWNHMWYDIYGNFLQKYGNRRNYLKSFTEL